MWLGFNKLTNLFVDLPLLTKVDLTNSNFSSCTELKTLYKNCSALDTVIMDGVDLAACSTFNDVFSNCLKLARVSMKGIDLTKCSSLAFLNRSTITQRASEISIDLIFSW